MFDIIRFKCTECGKWVEAQSKGGECLLEVFDCALVPYYVAADANAHAPHKCECGAEFIFEDFINKTVCLVPIKTN